MGENVVKNTYLDFEGLKKYDSLIKGFIASGNSDLANAIAALDAKLGDMDVEGSDSKTVSEKINEIYSALADIAEKHESLDSKDEELKGLIDGIVGDLDSLEGSDVVMTLVEITNKLKTLDASVLKNTQDIVGVTERVAAVEEAIKDLGEIEGGENLGSIVNKVNANAEAIVTLKGEGEGSVKKTAKDAADVAEKNAKDYADSLATNYDAAGAADTAEQNAKDYADSLATNYDAAGAAAAAQTAAENTAKTYADSLDTAMNERVVALEAIDHDKIAADAVAAVVAGAESDFDTLKEVADWIASDKEGSAALQTTVSNHTESIETINSDIDALEKKVDGDIANLTTHMSDAATALAEVDGRLDALEAFDENLVSIDIADIEGLFA
jgi:hypothetical protein